MTLKEAHALALQVLKQVMEEKLDENNVQLAQVGHASFTLGSLMTSPGDEGEGVPDPWRAGAQGDDRGRRGLSRYMHV